MIKSPNRAAQEMYKPDPGIPFYLYFICTPSIALPRMPA